MHSTLVWMGHLRIGVYLASGKPLVMLGRPGLVSVGRTLNLTKPNGGGLSSHAKRGMSTCYDVFKITVMIVKPTRR